MKHLPPPQALLLSYHKLTEGEKVSNTAAVVLIKFSINCIIRLLQAKLFLPKQYRRRRPEGGSPPNAVNLDILHAEELLPSLGVPSRHFDLPGAGGVEYKLFMLLSTLALTEVRCLNPFCTLHFLLSRSSPTFVWLMAVPQTTPRNRKNSFYPDNHLRLHSVL